MRVHKVERPYFRPPIPRDDQETAHYINIMLQCWEENPEDRPTIGTLRRVMRAVNPMWVLVYHNFQPISNELIGFLFCLFTRKGNIVDAMVKRLEKYACNLEELVASKTEELVQEKKKTDRLLYRMLPP